jgi:hypothetical protein
MTPCTLMIIWQQRPFLVCTIMSVLSICAALLSLRMRAACLWTKVVLKQELPLFVAGDVRFFCGRFSS